MSQRPQPPTDPSEMAAWAESLTAADVAALTEDLASGSLPDGNLVAQALRARPIRLPDPPAESRLLTIHLSLDETEPLVWRRITMPGSLTLPEVHGVLQAAMGWTDSHLHQFHLGRPWTSQRFLTDWDIEEGETGTVEQAVQLDQVLREPGDTLTYVYDFGDDWTHTLRLEGTAPLPAPPEGQDGTEASSAAYGIACLDGERACPPEDVGGIHGYEEMATWVRSGYAKTHLPPLGVSAHELRGWLPAGWDPDALDLDEVSVALGASRPSPVDRILATVPRELRQLVGRLPSEAAQLIEPWLAAGSWTDPSEPTAATAEALTTGFRVLLEEVGAGLKLTAAGYLPPRVVGAIYLRLRQPDDWMAEGSREDQTPPVANLREATVRLGLLRKVKGTLAPTARALAMRDDPQALLQHVVSRLPVEKDEFGRLAALLVLLATAGGSGFGTRASDEETRVGVLRTAAQVLVAAGWSAGSRPVSEWTVFHGAPLTLTTLDQMLRQVHDPVTARAAGTWIGRACLTAGAG